MQKFEECIRCISKNDNIHCEFSSEKYVDGYDRDGYDKDGYDRAGYDKFGFNVEHIHKVTLAKFDERGFYYDNEQDKYINNVTGNEYDALGYNVYGFNRVGFERPKTKLSTNLPKWHRPIKDENGRIVGYDVHGYEKCPVDYSPEEKNCNAYRIY